MKNYRIQIGNLKASAIWHEPKTENVRGVYTIGITKSEKDQTGNWKDSTVYLFPQYLIVMKSILEKMQNLFLIPQEFEIQKKNRTTTSTRKSRTIRIFG